MNQRVPHRNPLSFTVLLALVGSTMCCPIFTANAKNAGIIVLTTKGEESIQREALEAGANAVAESSDNGLFPSSLTVSANFIVE